MQDLVIYGNGRIAKIIYQFAKKQFNIVAFTVDTKFIESDRLEGVEVIPFETIQQKVSPLSAKMLIAVGYVDMNKVREEKYTQAKEMGYKFTNYIHPSVDMHDNVVVGENNVILDHVSIQPYAKVGNSNFLWSNCTIAHGVTLGDTNWVTSGVVIAGDTIVGSKCFIGVNSSLGHDITVKDSCFIGANSIVSKSTNEAEVYLSKDAQKIRLDSNRFMKFAGV